MNGAPKVVCGWATRPTQDGFVGGLPATGYSLPLVSEALRLFNIEAIGLTLSSR